MSTSSARPAVLLLQPFMKPIEAGLDEAYDVHRAFDMAIAYTDIRSFDDVPYRFVPTLLGLAEASDVLVVAAAGGPQSRGIVDEAVLNALGPDGILINVGRGSIVDEPALVAALAEGALAAPASTSSPTSRTCRGAVAVGQCRAAAAPGQRYGGDARRDGRARACQSGGALRRAAIADRGRVSRSAVSEPL